MKLRTLTFAVLSIALTGLLSAAEEGWRPLFNGKDLSGWETWLGVPLKSSNVPGAERDATGEYKDLLGLNKDPLQCFSVVEVDGKPAIRLSGEGFGTLTTLDSFSNYHLRVQFKWGTKKWLPGGEKRPRSSGVLYHGFGNHGDGDTGKRWLHCQQFQMQEGTCGEYVAVGNVAAEATARSVDGKKYIYDPAGPVVLFSSKPPSRCTNSAIFEKAGDWNTLELICIGDTVVHVMNGHVVVRLAKSLKVDGASMVPLTAGRIQLQMEGSEVFFRDLEVRPASELPKEYRAN